MSDLATWFRKRSPAVDNIIGWIPPRSAERLSHNRISTHHVLQCQVISYNKTRTVRQAGKYKQEEVKFMITQEQLDVATTVICCNNLSEFYIMIHSAPPACASASKSCVDPLVLGVLPAVTKGLLLLLCLLETAPDLTI